MALSEMSIRHARITGIDYTLGDSDGLTLNVTASGGKIWLFRYYWTGKQKRMSLGCYPQISLKEARTLVAQGINPYERRKTAAPCWGGAAKNLDWLCREAQALTILNRTESAERNLDSFLVVPANI